MNNLMKLAGTNAIAGMDPVLIAGGVAGMVWLFAQGWLLGGLMLAGLILALLAYFYGTDSPLPPLSKEEELAMWGVRWELDNPILKIDEPTPKGTKPLAQLQGGM